MSTPPTGSQRVQVKSPAHTVRLDAVSVVEEGSPAGLSDDDHANKSYPTTPVPPPAGITECSHPGTPIRTPRRRRRRVKPGHVHTLAHSQVVSAVRTAFLVCAAALLIALVADGTTRPLGIPMMHWMLLPIALAICHVIASIVVSILVNIVWFRLMPNVLSWMRKPARPALRLTIDGGLFYQYVTRLWPGRTDDASGAADIFLIRLSTFLLMIGISLWLRLTAVRLLSMQMNRRAFKDRIEQDLYHEQLLAALATSEEEDDEVLTLSRSMAASMTALLGAKHKQGVDTSSSDEKAVAGAEAHSFRIPVGGGRFRILESSDDARAWGRELFKRLDEDEDGQVNLADFANRLPRDDAVAAWKLFDRDADLSVDENEFAETLEAIYKERLFLIDSVRDRQHLYTMVGNVVGVVYWMAIMWIGFMWFGYDPAAFAVSAAAVLVGFGFIFGPILADLVRSMVLTFIVHPYDIGDIVTFGHAPGMLLIVHEISFTHTVFHTPNGQRHSIANVSIAKYDIINWRRSRRCMLIFTIMYALDTPNDVTDEFYQRVKAYTTSEEGNQYFTGRTYWRVQSIHSAAGVEVQLWAESRAWWWETGKWYKARTAFLRMAAAEIKNVNLRLGSHSAISILQPGSTLASSDPAAAAATTTAAASAKLS